MMTMLRTYTIVILLVVIGVIGGLYGTIPYFSQDDQRLAEKIVKECSQEKESEKRALCYEKKVPERMDEGLSMDRAFQLARIIQEKDPSFLYCHVLAHNISAKETAKDPSKWKDVIAQAPAGICGNGALHGAFQERFRAESLPDASEEEIRNLMDGACEPRSHWQPTLLERSSCMHGMGHLFLYITEANVGKSVALCNALARAPDHDFRETCFEGTFMQIYQPLEPEDTGLVRHIAPQARDRTTFCARFPGLAHAACIKESWPVLKDRIMTRSGFEEVCASLEGSAGYDNCVVGLTYTVMAMKEYNAPSMLGLCKELSSRSLRDICVSSTAVRFIETDWKKIPEALAVCASRVESESACWQGLITYGENGLKPDSLEAHALCGGMPEPFRSTCATRTKTSL